MQLKCPPGIGRISRYGTRGRRERDSCHRNRRGEVLILAPLLSPALGAVLARIERRPPIAHEAHTMSARPRTIDQYLALLSNQKREYLRRAIMSAAPKAEVRISPLEDSP